MRLRNIKDKDDILNSCSIYISNPKDYRGKFKDVFGNDNPIYIEIGTGKCGFIYNFAKDNPNINFVGIEKFKSVLALGVKKYDFNNMNNVRLISIDAIELKDVFLNEVDRIYLNFSDPWPKKRHEKRRLTSKEYLKCYDNLFKGCKYIIQKTDNRKLFEYSLLSLLEYGYILEEIHLDLHKDEINDNIVTEYEEKFIKKGMPIFMLKMRKKL